MTLRYTRPLLDCVGTLAEGSGGFGGLLFGGAVFPEVCLGFARLFRVPLGLRGLWGVGGRFREVLGDSGRGQGEAAGETRGGVGEVPRLWTKEKGPRIKGGGVRGVGRRARAEGKGHVQTQVKTEGWGQRSSVQGQIGWGWGWGKRRVLGLILALAALWREQEHPSPGLGAFTASASFPLFAMRPKLWPFPCCVAALL